MRSTLRKWIRSYAPDSETWLITLTILMACAVISIIGFVVCVKTWGERIVIEREIVSLKGTSSAQGRFILGTGIVKDVPKYYFYVSRGDSLFLYSAPAENLSIVEKDGPPHVRYSTQTCVPDTGLCVGGPTIFYELQVPVGTIRSQFDLMPD